MDEYRINVGKHHYISNFAIGNLQKPVATVIGFDKIIDQAHPKRCYIQKHGHFFFFFLISPSENFFLIKFTLNFLLLNQEKT